MALAVAALAAEGETEIEDAECVAVSFPEFYDVLERGARPVVSRRRPQRIVLVGFMGAGKSTVGAALAERLGWAFLDLDRWIEERHGLTRGRDLPRPGRGRSSATRSARAARAASRLRRHVVAAGGGAFAQPGTREALRAGAFTVWLRCDLGSDARPHPRGRQSTAGRGS